MSASTETGLMSSLLRINTNASTAVESYCERKRQDGEEDIENFFFFLNLDHFHLFVY